MRHTLPLGYELLSLRASCCAVAYDATIRLEKNTGQLFVRHVVARFPAAAGEAGVVVRLARHTRHGFRAALAAAAGEAGVVVRLARHARHGFRAAHAAAAGDGGVVVRLDRSGVCQNVHEPGAGHTRQPLTCLSDSQPSVLLGAVIDEEPGKRAERCDTKRMGQRRVRRLPLLQLVIQRGAESRQLGVCRRVRGGNKRVRAGAGCGEYVPARRALLRAVADTQDTQVTTSSCRFTSVSTSSATRSGVQGADKGEQSTTRGANAASASRSTSQPTCGGRRKNQRRADFPTFFLLVLHAVAPQPHVPVQVLPGLARASLQHFASSHVEVVIKSGVEPRHVDVTLGVRRPWLPEQPCSQCANRVATDVPSLVPLTPAGALARPPSRRPSACLPPPPTR